MTSKLKFLAALVAAIAVVFALGAFATTPAHAASKGVASATIQKSAVSKTVSFATTPRVLASASSLGYCGPPFTSKAMMIAWLQANPVWAAKAEAYLKRYASYYNIRSDQTIIAYLQMPNVKFKMAPAGYTLTGGPNNQPPNTGCGADGSVQAFYGHLDAGGIPGLFWCNDPSGSGFDCFMLAKFYCRNWVHGPMAFPKPYVPVKKQKPVVVPTPGKTPIWIRKHALDETNQLLVPTPTNVFRFKVQCGVHGKPRYIVYQSDPQSAGSCPTSAGKVLIWEMTTLGPDTWTSLTPNYQTFTLSGKKVLAVFKDRESKPTFTATICKKVVDGNGSQLGNFNSTKFTFHVTWSGHSFDEAVPADGKCYGLGPNGGQLQHFNQNDVVTVTEDQASAGSNGTTAVNGIWSLSMTAGSSDMKFAFVNTPVAAPKCTTCLPPPNSPPTTPVNNSCTIGWILEKDGRTVNFNVNPSSYNGPNSTISFGDGSSGPGLQVSHTYGSDGNWTATANITFNDGSKASCSVVVTTKLATPPPPNTNGNGQPTSGGVSGNNPQAGTPGSTVPTGSDGNVLPPP